MSLGNGFKRNRKKILKGEKPIVSLSLTLSLLGFRNSPRPGQYGVIKSINGATNAMPTFFFRADTVPPIPLPLLREAGVISCQASDGLITLPKKKPYGQVITSGVVCNYASRYHGIEK